jgi:hypothetical protein
MTLEQLDPDGVRTFVKNELFWKMDQNIRDTMSKLNVETLCRFFYDLDQVVQRYTDPRDLRPLPLEVVHVDDSEYQGMIQTGQREGVSITFTNEDGAFKWAVSVGEYWLKTSQSFLEIQQFCVENGMKYRVFDPYYKALENKPEENPEIEKYL